MPIDVSDRGASRILLREPSFVDQDIDHGRSTQDPNAPHDCSRSKGTCRHAIAARCRRCWACTHQLFHGLHMRLRSAETHGPTCRSEKQQRVWIFCERQDSHADDSISNQWVTGRHKRTHRLSIELSMALYLTITSNSDRLPSDFEYEKETESTG